MLEVAQNAVALARQTLKRFDLPAMNTWTKGGNPRDLVSDADQAIEETVREFLSSETPEIPLIGEEFSPDAVHDTAWVLDPIDGTVNFLQGLDYYTISLGMIKNGVPEVGVILNPSQDWLYQAQRGSGAVLNQTRIETWHPATLADSFICLEWGRSDESIHAGLELMQLFVPKVRDYRYFGGAAQTLCHVAEGKLDLYIDHDLKLWDYAAGWCILNECGGKLSNISFNGIDLIIAGGNEALVSAAVKLVSERQDTGKSR